MFIIHRPECAIRFSDFGIDIPSAGSRAERILHVLGQDPRLGPRRDQWLRRDDPAAATPEDLARVHSRQYVATLLSDDPAPAVLRAFELIDAQGNHNRYDPAKAALPLSRVVDKALANAAASHLAMRACLETGFAFFLGGGMHHAMPGFGRGFCLVHEFMVAVRKLQAEGLDGPVWIIDLDAHRGDGTAALAVGDDSVLTLSIHMARGWPLDAPPLDKDGRLDIGRYPSDVDIPVPRGGEAGYVPALARGLDLLEALSFGRKPGLAVVVDGADPYEHDELPSAKPLALTLEQMAARDRLVHDFLHARGLPQAWLLSGGYGARSWEPYAAFLGELLPAKLAQAAD